MTYGAHKVQNGEMSFT